MEESRAITRSSASNLAFTFFMLPKAKRDAMAALYAFCRQVDDVADEESKPVEQRRAELAKWREDVRTACGPGQPVISINRELQPVIHQYSLPFDLFNELLCGVEMDLSITRYPDYEALELYCYRVASVVGLLSIEIFGYQDPRCRDYAIYLGKALQFTNILRDVGGDAQRGRVYLPLCELERHRVTPEEILRGEYSNRFRDAAQAVAERARGFYRRAQECLPSPDRRSMIAAESMGSVYWRILRKVERHEFRVLGPEPTRLNKLQKILLILRTWYRLGSGAMAPNYGA